MGCLKLPYYEKDDRPNFLGLWKKSDGKENGDNYYPFGLTFNSYQRENSVQNKYLYNQGTGDKTFNTERILDLGLNVDMTKFRVYDPAMGRWWQVDPKADSLTNFSPYNYSFNNPIRYNDPFGDCPPGTNCNTGTSMLKAALQSNVTSNINAAGSSASNIVTGTLGVQAAGIGGKINIAGALHVEATGKAFSGEASFSGKGPDANVSAVTTEFGIEIAGVGGSYSQDDMKYDGNSFQMRDQSGNVKGLGMEYGTSKNEISVGATVGALSGEISLSVDAVKQTINNTVEATRQFFQNLFPDPTQQQ